MPDFYLQEGQRFEAEGATTSISEGTELTSSGSTNTKGSYTQLVASTGFAASGLLITLGGQSNAGAGFLTDIAVGGAGSEQVIVPNLLYIGDTDGTITALYLPVPVKAGSRLSARTACSTASGKHRILVIPVAGGFQSHPGASNVVTYGVDTSVSQGTSVVASSTANTKGSWVQLTASTTAPMSWAAVMIRAAVNTQFLIDIGIGGSGSEVVLIPNLNLRGTPQNVITWAFPLRIAKGTRIAARCQDAAGGASKDVRMLIVGVG